MAEPQRARTKKDVVTEFRKTEIIDAARRVIVRDGLRGASMDRVAEEAGVAKGTLYLYFADKAALFSEATERGHAEMARHVAEIMGEAADPEAAIEAYIRGTLQFCQDNETLFRAMQAHPDSAGDPAAKAVERQIAGYVDRLEGVIARGVAQGALRIERPRRGARLIVEAVRGVVIERLREAAPPPVEDDTRTLLAVIMRGIGAENR